MATTSIWKVTGHLSKVVNYAENPIKTENPNLVAAPSGDYEADGLGDVLAYTTRQDATDRRYLVSGINCLPASAVSEMYATKRLFGKDGGIIAFHGYQSFAPGETTPEIAHEIGVKLARALWGDRFEMVVSTHIDKSHIHNHVIVNSVSYVDGKRFHRDKKTYAAMRQASDELCQEYGLSVIDEPKSGTSKHHAEWKAESEGKPTWRSTIKADVDEAIDKAMTDKQFFANLTAMGYEYRIGKDISVRPPGKERYLRLARNFGEDYTQDGIRSRLLGHRYPRMPITKHRPQGFVPPKKLPFFARGSLLALHRHHLYLIGYYTERGSPGANARMHYLLKEDLAKLNIYIEDTKLLTREDIATTKQLHSFMDTCKAEIEKLTTQRAELKCQIRAAAGDGMPYTTKTNPHYQQINQRLRTLRKEVMQCGRIEERSRSLADRIERIEQDEDRQTQQPQKGGSKSWMQQNRR